mgnify:CR=1 FL=1
MHVVFLEPAFPANQKEFVRGLHAVGAKVTGIGERAVDALPADVRQRLFHYEQVSSVVDDEAVLRIVRWAQERLPVDRLEATVEAHVMTAARVREACGIPGTSVRTAWLCRDKPAMKEALSAAGIPCAQSAGAGSAEEAHRFADGVGYPPWAKTSASAIVTSTSPPHRSCI